MKTQDFSASHETAPSPVSVGFALRILRGWHAGAQISVPPGETLRLGGREDCDIVLTDDDVAQSTLQIRLAQSIDGNVTGWQLALHAAPMANDDDGNDDIDDGKLSGEQDAVIAFDTPRHIGQLTITVSRADAPWPAVHLPDDETSSGAAGTPSDGVSAPSGTPEDGTTADKANANAASGPLSDTHEASRAAQADTSGSVAAGDATADAMDPTNRDAALRPNGGLHGKHGGTAGNDAASRAALPWPLFWLSAWIPAWLAMRLSAMRPVPSDNASRPETEGLRGILRRRLRRAFGRPDVGDGERGAVASAGGVPTHWLMAGGALAIIAALFMLILLVPRQTPSVLPPSSPIAVDVATQVEHALRAGGWIDGIRVDLDPQGNVTVAGWVLDEAARDRLSATLARLTPMPAMRIQIVADAVKAARDATAPFGPFLTVDAGRIGEIRIRGVVLSPTGAGAGAIAVAVALPAIPLSASSVAATARASSAATTAASTIAPEKADTRENGDDPLLAALRLRLHAAFAAAVPDATLNDADVVTADGAVRALGEAMSAADLSMASIHWERIGIDAASDGPRQAVGTHALGQLVVDALLGTDAAQLQRTLAAFHRRYGDRIPIHALIGGTRATFTPALLPFALVAVSSGLLPSVVVDGNVRMLPGGSYRGFRLMYIDDATVVFDREMAPGTTTPSQRIVLQR
jgi:hypothetical protein